MFSREGGAYHTPDEREQKLAVAMRGGIHQSNKPFWSFREKRSMTYGNRKIDNSPATSADRDVERAETRGYHTTVEPWVEGEQLAKEMLNLIGGEGEAVAVFREQILNNCFRELELDSWSKWEHLLGASIGWKDLAATIRLGQCQHEAEQQGVEMAPWYYMSAALGEGGHTPYRPWSDDVCSGNESASVCHLEPS